MRKPDFFIVGAPRCGTTSMFAYLRQHPEIFGSVHKEPQFFGSDLTPLAGSVREEELYLSLFAGAEARRRAGEASVWYLLSQRAPHEIRAFSPAAKIIILLRDPVDMAYSLHTLYTRSGNEDLTDFAAALAAEPERRLGRRLPPGVYFPEGLQYSEVVRHAAKVERYLEVFGRGQVHVVLLDDLVRDAAAVYRRTLEFLEVDADFQADLDPARASQKVRMLSVRQLRLVPAEVKRRMQFKERENHDSASQRPPLDPLLAARLRQQLAADVARLGALLGRDLSAWTRGRPAPPAPPAPPTASATLAVAGVAAAGGAGPAAGSGRREPRAGDDEALVGAGAEGAGRRLDLHREAEEAAAGDGLQADAHSHRLAGAGGADVRDLDARADRGLAVAEERLDERQAGVLDQADHARGREDAVDVRRAHRGGDGVGRLGGQPGTEAAGGGEGGGHGGG